MKQFLLLAGMAAISFAQSPLTAAKNVYVLPMPGGLDQFVALRLTEQSVLQVVTDSAKADVFITDRIGEDFEQLLKELTTPPVDTSQAQKAGTTDPFAHPNMRPLARTRGTVFLIERNTGNVLWSTLEIPKSATARDMSAAAQHIVDRLAKAKK
ncbi:MAG: hypothetical protein ABI811_22005 [Acidobacteriota bacterium]